MGLNWYGGAQGASKGLETLLGVQSKNIDMLYDQVTRENHDRFASAEAEKQRQFVKEQADTEWSRKMPLEYGKLNLQGQQIEATNKLQQAQLEATTAYQNANIGIQQQRNEMTGLANAATAESRRATNAREQAADDQKTLDAINEKIAAAEKDIVSTPEQRQSDINYWKEQRQLVTEYGADGAMDFTKIQSIMAGHPQTEYYGRAYALMKPEERRNVDREALRLQRDKKADGRRQAYAMAIDAVMGEGEAQTPAKEEKPPQNRSEGQGQATPKAETPEKKTQPQFTDLPAKPPGYDFSAEKGMTREQRIAAQNTAAVATSKYKKATKAQVEALAKELAKKDGFQMWGMLFRGQRNKYLEMAQEQIDKAPREDTRFIAASGGSK